MAMSLGHRTGCGYCWSISVVYNLIIAIRDLSQYVLIYLYTFMWMMVHHDS